MPAITPGSWFVRGNCIEAPSGTVAAIAKRLHDTPEGAADAALLAAAPAVAASHRDLIRVLEQIAGAWTLGRPPAETLKAIERAARAAADRAGQLTPDEE